MRLFDHFVDQSCGRCTYNLRCCMANVRSYLWDRKFIICLRLILNLECYFWFHALLSTATAMSKVYCSFKCYSVPYSVRIYVSNLAVKMLKREKKRYRSFASWGNCVPIDIQDRIFHTWPVAIFRYLSTFDLRSLPFDHSDSYINDRKLLFFLSE